MHIQQDLALLGELGSPPLETIANSEAQGVISWSVEGKIAENSQRSSEPTGESHPASFQYISLFSISEQSFFKFSTVKSRLVSSWPALRPVGTEHAECRTPAAQASPTVEPRTGGRVNQIHWAKQMVQQIKPLAV